MSSRDLPARPHLDHLKHQARALLKAARGGDAEALRRLRTALGDRTAFRLTDAQRVIAREYGFRSWARLRTHVQASRGIEEAVDAFLAAVEMQDVDGARRALAAQPDLASHSLHVAATLGLEAEARRLLREHPSQLGERRGPSGGEPLLFLCYSPFHGESAERDAGLLATARVLLDAGADPNTSDARQHVPALYAVTGVRSVLPLARLLLDAGANPTDGESIFHAAEHFHEDALELLMEYGADLNFVGEWGNTALHFLLEWHDLEREPRVRQGFDWLLAHGAEPDVRSGERQETALHVAARRGQGEAVVQRLLAHKADVHARRADGRTPWLLAMRGGFDALAALLEREGATAEALSPVDLLVAACGRGDLQDARRLTAPELVEQLALEDERILPESAARERWATVECCLAAAFPPDIADAAGATALHYSALRGRVEMVQALLAAGADTEIRDGEHRSTPLGWACFGADHIKADGGEYVECVRALIDGGARVDRREHRARDEGVAALLDEHS